MDKWHSGFLWAVWIIGIGFIIEGIVYHAFILSVNGFILCVISFGFRFILEEIEKGKSKKDKLLYLCIYVLLKMIIMSFIMKKEKVSGLSKRKKPGG